MEKLEKRLLKKMDQKLDDCNTKLDSIDKKLSETKDEFDTQTNNTKNECLWRIKDAEELIKGRVTQIHLDQQLKSLKFQVDKDFSVLKSKMETTIKTESQTMQTNLSQLVEFSERKYQDAKLLVLRTDEKLLKLASKE